MGNVVILGAKGRFGRATTKAFLNAGWSVDAVARKWEGDSDTEGVTRVVGDGMDMASIENVCRGHKFIVNAFNPPYHRWERELPVLTKNVINAAAANGATVLLPGNVYVYGSALPSVLSETTDHVANTKKGRLRIEMENAYMQARDRGVRTIVLRAGDFIEGKATGNWFENHMANKVDQGVFTYPGRLDVDHAWAYLPDMARAMVALCEQADQLDPFAEFGFAGFTLTGEQLAEQTGKAIGKPLSIRNFPWFLLRFASLFSPVIREVFEMRYLWDKPHRIDGEKLMRQIPDFQATPIEKAFEDMLKRQDDHK